MFGCINNIYCTQQTKIVSKFLHKTVKFIFYLISQRVTFRCREVTLILFGLLFFIYKTWALFCCDSSQSFSHCTWVFAIVKSYNPALNTYRDRNLSCCFYQLSDENNNKKTECGVSTSLFSQYAILPIFIKPFQFCSVLFAFYVTKALYNFQMMSAEGQTSGRFLDFLLCLLELPGVLQGSRSRV